MPPYQQQRQQQYGRPDFIPEDRDQLRVETPYGRGTVIRTRKESKSGKVLMREIELTDWMKPNEVQSVSDKGSSLSRPPYKNKPTILYSLTEFPSVQPEIGSPVITIYGRGKVVEVRRNEEDGTIVTVAVRISSWRLAGRSLVTCYLSPDAVQVLRPQTIYDMNAYDRVEHAQELKQQAATQFSAKKYNEALELYAQAVDAVRYVQHTKESSNELRADLLVVMITCCNNAATCCLKLEYWDRAQKFGRNALVLLDALLEKKGNSKIHQLLSREGTSDSQLFGTWKVKSCLVVARALAQQHESQQAIDTLKRAVEVIATYKVDQKDSMYQQLVTQEKEIRRLHTACKERLKAERQKEKKRAMAMFGGGGSSNSGSASRNDNGTSEEKKDGDKKQGEEPYSTIRAPTTYSPPVSPPRGIPTMTTAATVTGNEDVGLPPPPSSSAETGAAKRGFAKRRVSFADGSRPGEEIEADEPGFFDEHKEAMFLMGGVAIGSFLLHALLRKR